MHFDFQKTPVLQKKHLCHQKEAGPPKITWPAKKAAGPAKSTGPAKNHLPCQKPPGPPKITWPAKNHQARQKSPALPKSTRPSGRFCTLFLKDIDSSTGTYLPGSPHGQGSGHLWKSKTFIQCLRIRTRQVLDAQIMISLRSADTEHVRRLF